MYSSLVMLNSVHQSSSLFSLNVAKKNLSLLIMSNIALNFLLNFIIIKLTAPNKQYKTVAGKRLLNVKRLTWQPFHLPVVSNNFSEATRTYYLLSVYHLHPILTHLTLYLPETYSSSLIYPLFCYFPTTDAFCIANSIIKLKIVINKTNV